MHDSLPTRSAAELQASFNAWLDRLQAAPYAHGFYLALRRIETAHPHLPRLGEAKRPSDEAVRVAQPADLSFAPSAIQSIERRDGRTLRLQQRIFGLIGPNGPLPIHITELARERLKHHADPTLQGMLDMLTHRFALLFYRAWAQGQPVVGLDRKDEDPFARRLASLAGVDVAAGVEQDSVGLYSKLHLIGRLARQVRDAEGLRAWCRLEFSVPLQIVENSGHWLALGLSERSRLGAWSQGQGVGRGAVAGRSVWDVQHKFRIVVGPLTLAQYQDFLPGGASLPRLQAVVRQWLGLELDWDLQLVLRAADVPTVRLGQANSGAGTPLGLSSWMCSSPPSRDRRDLILDVDRALAQHRRRASRQRLRSASAAAAAGAESSVTEASTQGNPP